FHLRLVDLFTAGCGAQQPICQLTVIGQDQDARGVIIETTYGKHLPPQRAHEIHDNRPAFRVLGRRHIVVGLVQDIVDTGPRGPDAPAVDLEMIPRPIDLCSWSRDDGAVYRDAPLGDPSLRLSSGGDPGP